jgi:Domain of unknown function (DUF3427)
LSAQFCRKGNPPSAFQFLSRRFAEDHLADVFVPDLSIIPEQFHHGIRRLGIRGFELLYFLFDRFQFFQAGYCWHVSSTTSVSVFHWQSQSQTSEESDAGRRYVEQAKNGWTFLAFVRPTVEEEFVAIGRMEYESHTGSRPMSITWRLSVVAPMASSFGL